MNSQVPMRLRFKRNFTGLLLSLIGMTFCQAAVINDLAPAKWGDWPDWGDQGDGTYRNPVLPADFSDIDCIRVGSDYYAISSTMQFSPGMAVIHSKDLVNWQIIGHVVSDLTQIGPELNWDRMNRAGRGIWAGAIRHHAGKFWVYFGTPDEGYFMSSATNAAGPWAPLHQMTTEAGWDDCCPFWDDDGQGYFVGTHFAGGYKTWLYKLTPDGRDLIKDSGRIILEGRSREASKLYKFNGYYYHFFSENKSVGRYVMMQRATNLFGPDTEMKQLTHGERSANQPNQGGIVQAETGDWYFYTHHGTGDWEGRCNSLLPVTWRDGWPVPGAVGADGIGRMVWSGKKPVPDVPMVRMQTSDDFNAPNLPPQWEWNYQPRSEKWSLTERPGWLRLHAFKPLAADNLLKAGNTLTQRTLRTATNTVVVKLDLSGMADGQKAGLCHFARSHSALGVAQSGTVRKLEFRRNGIMATGPVLTNDLLWLKSTWGLEGRSHFAYSLDGIAFTPFGEAYQFDWGHYRGNRVGLYSFNNQAEAGYVAVDWFHHDYAGPGRRE
jgi:beta-xylosidase